MEFPPKKRSVVQYQSFISFAHWHLLITAAKEQLATALLALKAPYYSLFFNLESVRYPIVHRLPDNIYSILCLQSRAKLLVTFAASQRAGFQNSVFQQREES